MKPDEIRAWRKRLGLRQSDAAKLLGVSVRTWNGWEMGHYPPMYAPMLAYAMAWLELDAANADDESRILIASLADVPGDVPDSAPGL